MNKVPNFANILDSLIVAGLLALFTVEYSNGQRLARLETQIDDIKTHNLARK